MRANIYWHGLLGCMTNATTARCGIGSLLFGAVRLFDVCEPRLVVVVPGMPSRAGESTTTTTTAYTTPPVDLTEKVKS